MELTALFEQVLSHSPFIGFLLYQYWQQRKDMKEMQERYEALRKESKLEEEKLRERYQKVIQDYTKDRQNLVDSLEKRILSLEKSIRKIFSILEELKVLKMTVDRDWETF